MTRARILADYVAGGTTAAEFDYMDGVTSNVQTQLDAKLALAGGTMTGDLVPDTPMSHRNMIINGAMNVAQRTTSVVSGTTTVDYKSLDRFKFEDQMGSAQVQYDQTSLTGANIPAVGLMNAHKISLYSTAESPSAAEYFYMEQIIEAQNISHLLYGTASAKAITLSFYVRSNKDGVYGVQAITPDGTAYDIGTTYTVSGTAWQRVTWTIPGNASGQIDNNNGAGMRIRWWLSAGTDSTTTSNTSWGAEATGRRAYGQTAQLFANSGNYIEFTGVQLELGSSATPFEHRSYGDELRRCQRYYEKGTCASTAPIRMWPINTDNDGGYRRTNIWLANTMRAVPNPITITIVAAGSTSSGVQFETTTSFVPYSNQSAASGEGNVHAWTAEAEL